MFLSLSPAAVVPAKCEVISVKDRDCVCVCGCRRRRANACHLAFTVLQYTTRECSFGYGCLRLACSSIHAHPPTCCGKQCSLTGTHDTTTHSVLADISTHSRPLHRCSALAEAAATASLLNFPYRCKALGQQEGLQLTYSKIDRLEAGASSDVVLSTESLQLRVQADAVQALRGLVQAAVANLQAACRAGEHNAGQAAALLTMLLLTASTLATHSLNLPPAGWGAVPAGHVAPGLLPLQHR